MNLKLLFGDRPTDEEKRKAAMVLNLCATSISRIIASNDMEVLDVEYNAILNNLNLQNMIKDESLLSTFKSILDTITFYRLQAGDRKRAEVRYQQKLNSAIWSVGQQGTCILFAPTNAWAAISGAIMAVGAFCNYKKTKSDARVAYEDELWKLERSLIEQLHALRYSLFETAWRLSSKYDFADAWRLTIPQIEQYNQILDEPDAAWRYFRLAQYKENFEAYPYYWNELGESAFIAANKDGMDEAIRNDFLAKAEAAFEAFVSKDARLLREDMIAAAARLRRVQIAVLRGNTWEESVDGQFGFLHDLKSLACSAPDLLMQAAIFYASAYESGKSKRHLDAAIGLMEMVVAQGYDQPTSSRLLSKMYLLGGNDRECDYANLHARFGDAGVIKNGDNAAQILVEADSSDVKAELRRVFSRQFDLAKRVSNGGLFVGDASTVDGKIEKYIASKSLRLDASVKDMLTLLWVDIKQALNAQMRLVVEKIGVKREHVKEVACALNANVVKEINEYSGNVSEWISQKGRTVQQQRGLNRIVNHAEEAFVEGLVRAADLTFDLKRMDDIMAVSDGLSAVERELAIIMRKLGVSAGEGGRIESEDFFTSGVSVENVKELKWSEYKSDPSIGEKLMRDKRSFRVLLESMKDVVPASWRLEEELERMNYKVRVYTQGTFLAACNVWGAAVFVAHRLCTINPDYEVIRYPRSIEVRYMLDSIDDTSEDNSTAKKIADDVCYDVKGVWHFITDIFKR